jgi:putative SOS response-associated peptidase YedK
MCGRFTLGAMATDLAAQFNLATVPTWAARLHRWGLVPSWANDPAIGNRLRKVPDTSSAPNA